MVNKTRIAIITNIIPPYREDFYDRILTVDNLEVTVYAHKQIPFLDIKSIHNKYPGHVKIMKCYADRRLEILWQRIPAFDIFKSYDIIFVDGNPRHIAQALFASVCALLGKKVVVWSSVYSYRNNGRLSEKMRLLWWKLTFRHFLMYNEADIKYLKALHFNPSMLHSINNGLNQGKISTAIKTWNCSKLTAWQAKRNLISKRIIISSSRLEPGRYDEMVKALPDLLVRFPDLCWCIIGDGKAKGSMENVLEEYIQAGSVIFAGATYNEEELAPWFLSAEIFVYPTAVGLSLLHAFGYGLPVVTHNKSTEHGPEFSLFRNLETGMTYEKGNMHHLVQTITCLLKDVTLLSSMRANVSFLAQERYNTAIMAARFISCVSTITQQGNKN